jgi:Universal stress protein family
MSTWESDLPAARQVLVAVDRERSPLLSAAADLARRGHGRLTVLACLKGPPPLAWCDPHARALLDQGPAASERFLNRILQEVPRDVSVTGHLKASSVRRALAAETRDHEYDAVVIDDREQRRLARSWRSRPLMRRRRPVTAFVVPGC